MAVSDGALRIARKLLLPVQEQNDFEFLAAQPIWSNQPLRLLLQHMHLANYNRTLVDWKVEDDLYREYVLSPVITFATSAPSVYPPAALHHPFTPDFDWRRILWEHFYPRIRKEGSVAAAAEIVLRRLRERVTLHNESDAAKSLRDCWQSGYATDREFALLTVAVLRSVGIPVRFSSFGTVEYFDGEKWRTGPRAP